MMAPYLLRLLCLSLAVFFAIHFSLGLLVSLAGGRLARAARHMRPSSAVRLLLAMRMMPAALGILVVAGICVPSYLWLEPEFSKEEIGFTCLAAAILGGLLWILSVARAMRGTLRAMRHTRACRNLGRPSGLMGWRVPVWVLETQTPLFALVGVFRSGVILSDAVVKGLTPAQLGAACGTRKRTSGHTTISSVCCFC